MSFVEFQIKGERASRVKAWVDGVPVEPQAKDQLLRTASLPIVQPWVAAMPDVHLGKGASVGTVIPTVGAIIPAAVGVDLGCGMMATQTSLTASDLPESLRKIRTEIENAVPVGRAGWKSTPSLVVQRWKSLARGHRQIADKHGVLAKGDHASQLGTLGGGNHFIEICLDEKNRVWVVLHSGSRGIGNRIGTYFIELAQRDMQTHLKNLPDRELAYLREGTKHFDEYLHAVNWAQDYAETNRQVMMQSVLEVLHHSKELPEFRELGSAVNCHHNYVKRESHFGQSLWITRKGALSARRGELGIIPGSMGAKTFIVRGKGNADSFTSCAHGAGRQHSRTAAKKLFSLRDHERATQGIECRKDTGVLDETPGAYKDIEQVMAAQSDLVEPVHELRQVLVVKG